MPRFFNSALDIIHCHHKDRSTKYLGWLDNWIIEFFPLLAAHFSNAHFVIIFRDVRSSIASTLKRPDVINAPATISFKMLEEASCIFINAKRFFTF